MNDDTYEVQHIKHSHDRYGVHTLRAKPRSLIKHTTLLPTNQPIDPAYRLYFPSIEPGDVVHCQGVGEYHAPIVFKEPSRTDRILCACGAEYVSTPTKVYCPNLRCSRTEYGRLAFFIGSFFQKTLNQHAHQQVLMDLAFSSINSLDDFLCRDMKTPEGITYQLVKSCRLMAAGIRMRRDINDPEQNAFILSLIDALGLPDLRLDDIYHIFAHESIDYQNGDGGDVGEYYYNALSQPEYLRQITEMSITKARAISNAVMNRSLSSTFSVISRFGNSWATSNDDDDLFL